MDEAEYLGDKIAIIGDGKLICYGSSIYLKALYKVGYKLVIVKNSKYENIDKALLLIKGIIQDYKILSNMGCEFILQLPIEELNKFPELLLALEENLADIGAQSYGISIHSLEEVFLNVTKKNNQKYLNQDAIKEEN